MLVAQLLDAIIIQRLPEDQPHDEIPDPLFEMAQRLIHFGVGSEIVEYLTKFETSVYMPLRDALLHALLDFSKNYTEYSSIVVTLEEYIYGSDHLACENDPVMVRKLSEVLKVLMGAPTREELLMVLLRLRARMLEASDIPGYIAKSQECELYGLTAISLLLVAGYPVNALYLGAKLNLDLPVMKNIYDIALTSAAARFPDKGDELSYLAEGQDVWHDLLSEAELSRFYDEEDPLMIEVSQLGTQLSSRPLLPASLNLVVKLPGIVGTEVSVRMPERIQNSESHQKLIVMIIAIVLLLFVLVIIAASVTD